MKGDVEPVYVPPRPSEVRHSFADVSKANKLLNFKPKIRLEEGLAKTVNWFNDAR
jgi:UDP-N-acetylglucosamine 4-epimerase